MSIRQASAAADPCLSIVICTFHREEPLAALLVDLGAQIDKLGGTPGVAVIVVDNSDEGSAARVLGAARAGPVPGLTAIQAHPASISIARNAGVAACRGVWVAFLDDDSILPPDWLAVVLGATATTQADGLFGPVRAQYEGGRAPDFDPEGRMFSRDIDAPSGTRVHIGGPRRPRNAVMGTANSILRRATCLADPDPFNAAYGGSGGEDMDLFLRLEQRGRRFAWCAEAVVGEWVPASRQGSAYALLRCFVGGQVFVAVTVRNSASPRWTEAWLLAIALMQCGLGAARLAWAKAFRPGLAEGLRLRVAAPIGKLRWRRPARMYAMERRGQTGESLRALVFG